MNFSICDQTCSWCSWYCWAELNTSFLHWHIRLCLKGGHLSIPLSHFVLLHLFFGLKFLWPCLLVPVSVAPLFQRNYHLHYKQSLSWDRKLLLLVKLDFISLMCLFIFCLDIYLQTYQKELFLSVKHGLPNHALTHPEFGISMGKAETWAHIIHFLLNLVEDI